MEALERAGCGVRITLAKLRDVFLEDLGREEERVDSEDLFVGIQVLCVPWQREEGLSDPERVGVLGHERHCEVLHKRVEFVANCWEIRESSQAPSSPDRVVPVGA